MTCSDCGERTDTGPCQCMLEARYEAEEQEAEAERTLGMWERLDEQERTDADLSEG